MSRPSASDRSARSTATAARPPRSSSHLARTASRIRAISGGSPSTIPARRIRCARALSGRSGASESRREHKRLEDGGEPGVVIAELVELLGDEVHQAGRVDRRGSAPRPCSATPRASASGRWRAAAPVERRRRRPDRWRLPRRRRGRTEPWVAAPGWAAPPEHVADSRRPCRPRPAPGTPRPRPATGRRRLHRRAAERGADARRPLRGPHPRLRGAWRRWRAPRRARRPGSRRRSRS